MTFVGWVKRHRAAVAGNTALAIAAGAVVVYAVNAQGYPSHEPELHSGGIWVTHADGGQYGRMNLPIEQLDGVVFGSESGGTGDVEVSQDGGTVLALKPQENTVQLIDEANLRLGQSEVVTAAGAAVLAHGGSIAAIEPGTGKVWAGRSASAVEAPGRELARNRPPRATVGAAAAMSITESGTVVAVSGRDHRVVELPVEGDGFEKPRSLPLPTDAGNPKQVTTVGEHVVTLDPATGTVHVLGASSVQVPGAQVLQQPGSDRDSVLVGTADGLVEVNLDSGAVTTRATHSRGTAIAPVRLGECVYGAWSGGSGALVQVCGDGTGTPVPLGDDAGHLVFRVNRGQIVLNDQQSGATWRVDTDNPVRIDNWDAFTSERVKQDHDEEQETHIRDRRRPPKAEPDRYGVRPGRTSTLYPLDNDTTQKGGLLAITAVDTPAIKGVEVTISPDGQTLQLHVPQVKIPLTRFKYYISDGRNGAADDRQVAGEITLRAATGEGSPALRANYQDPGPWRAASSGSLEIPVLGDWRDDIDSDPLSLAKVSVVNGTGDITARPTSSGRIRVEADQGDAETSRPRTATVRYTVTDGTRNTEHSLKVLVEPRNTQASSAPTANPDVVTGQAGRPIEIRPLANDLPGFDPMTPDARLELGGEVRSVTGLDVRTDLATGTITATGDRPGSHTLKYEARYGLAPLGTGTIRVDVRPSTGSVSVPVAMPDDATLFGQSSTVIDVLANDADPGGGLLMVQQASADRTNQMDVSVIEGRWLRIRARQGVLQPSSQLVRYTVSNGLNSAQGQVQVNQRSAPEDDSPVTAVDWATVRAGATVTSPVLENDFSPSGDDLHLVSEPAQSAGDTRGAAIPAGALPVERPADASSGPGAAYVVGRTLRYVAPPEVTQRETYQIPYTVANTAGETSQGRLFVQIVPTGDENQPPAASLVEGRVVAGADVRLRLPEAGSDPDGDSLSITNLESPPRLGRVVALGANSIEYQAYPGSAGTDEFSFRVVDELGASVISRARVAVTAPVVPQPPVAIPDSFDVAPGRTLQVSPMSNDQTTPGDRVELSLVTEQPGVSLEEKTGMVRIQVPEVESDAETVVVYRLSNGTATSTSTITVRTMAGANLPPVVQDAFGTADDSDQVSVEVLDGAYDPDGPASGLRLSRVFDPTATIEGSRVIAQRGVAPRVVPFEVTDADGAVTTASLYVPATGSGLPHARADARIVLRPGASRTVDLTSLVVDPSGGEVALSAPDKVWASPEGGLNAAAVGTGERLRVQADPDYQGPAALLVDVTGKTPTATSGTVAPRRTVVSIPVQVGRERPTLQCPTEPVEVVQGGSARVDVTALCHTFTTFPAQAEALEYHGEWDRSVAGLALIENDARQLQVTAAVGAEPGAEGVLAVRSEGSEPGLIRFRVVRAAPPSLLPIRAQNMKQSATQTIDIGRYLVSSLPGAVPTVQRIQRIDGSGIEASASGSVITLRSSARATGTSEFRVVASDMTSATGTARQVEGRLRVSIGAVPGAPGRPLSFNATVGEAITLTWPAARDNGSRIDRYELREIHTGRSRTCRTTSCTFQGLKTGGTGYVFRARAHNANGWGPWSVNSLTMVYDTRPNRVTDIKLVSRGDHTLTLRWANPRDLSSRITQYRIVWQGGQTTTDGEPEVTVSGLDNNRPYSFSIIAVNKIGMSDPRVSSAFWPLGTPSAPKNVAVQDLQTGEDRTDNRITWSATAAEGRGPTTYTVLHNDSPLPGCVNITALECNQRVDYDGVRHTYSVRARNRAGNRSPLSVSATILSTGRPASWGEWQLRPTGKNTEAQAAFTVPDSRGRQSNYAILVDDRAVFTASGTGARTERFLVPQNGTNYSVRLRVCNESRNGSSCSLSDPKTLRTYGPLDGHLAGITAVADGKNVRFRIRGSTNGSGARLRITAPGFAQRTFTLQRNPAFDQEVSYQIGYFGSLDITATLDDPDIDGRGSDSATGRGQSGNPPEPTLRVETGAYCNDNTGTKCVTAANPDDICDSPQGCAHVNLVVTSEWDAPMTCRFLPNPGIGWAGWDQEYSVAPGQNRLITPLYAKLGQGYSVQARCTYGGSRPGAGTVTSGSTPWK